MLQRKIKHARRQSNEDGNAILQGVNREHLFDESTFEQRLAGKKEKKFGVTRQNSNA